jgi:hypothetical protein
MNHDTTCKFCHMPLTLTIDDGYPADLDPHQLIQIAACNSCADARVARRVIEAKLGRVCYQYSILPIAKRDETRANVAAVLTKLTKDYASMIARWHKFQGQVWDQEAVNLLLDKPERWTDIISMLWKLFRDWQKEKHAKTNIHQVG